MSRIQAQTKLVTENFIPAKDWIGPLCAIYNKFVQEATRALNGGIEFGTNIKGEEQMFDFVFRSNTVSLPGFTWTLVNPPRAMTVVSAYENVNPSTKSGFSPIIINVAWQLNINNLVQLTDVVKLTSASTSVAGLTVGNRYQITVRVSP